MTKTWFSPFTKGENQVFHRTIDKYFLSAYNDSCPLKYRVFAEA